jgi:diaminopimelate epimerase
MDYYNADGGPAEMCGNGIRCLAVLAQKAGVIGSGEHTVLTGAGPVTVRLDGSRRVAVDMGVPALERPSVPMSGEGSSLRVGIELEDGAVLEGTGVGMGNPHLVLFLDDIGRTLDDALVHGLGPRLEHHAAFPNRTNVEFVDVVSRDEVRMRVWERGVGETQACGSGACAVAVAAAALGRTGRVVHVHLPGGVLHVDWRADDHVWMTGPAEEVFSGDIDSAWLSARGLQAPQLITS